MKLRNSLAISILVAMAPVAACSGGGGSGTSTPSPSPLPPPPPPPPPSGTGFVVDGLVLLDGDSSNRIEHARGVTYDAAGSTYIVGATPSADFPTTVGAYDRTYATGGTAFGSQGPLDGFITKINAQGQVVWSTYLGGPNFERIYAVKVDAAGDVYVAGRAGPGFPTTPGALQENFGGDSNPNSAYGPQDGFVTKIAGDGGSLIWSTYFGGPGRGFIRDIDIDPQGRVHIAAVSDAGLPYITANADRSNRLGVNDVVYAVLAADGRSVSYATYLGGTSTGSSFSPNPSVRVTPDGGAYIVYIDNATDVLTPGSVVQPSPGGGFDLLVSRISAQRAVSWTTYLGGSGREDIETHSLAVDANSRPIVIGTTFSKNFPTTTNSIQPNAASSSGSDADAFITILSANGDSLVASTYFGGSQNDELEGVATLSDGSVVVTGGTRSSFLPTGAGSFQTFNGGNFDGMLVRFSSDLTSVLYASYFGGSGNDGLTDVAAGPQDVVAFSGFTRSPNFQPVNSSDISVSGEYGAIYGRLSPN